MIIDAILAFLCSIPKQLINTLGIVDNIVIPQGMFDWFYDVFDTLTYVFPVWSLIPILTISIGIKTFQISWALVNKIWQILHG